MVRFLFNLFDIQLLFLVFREMEMEMEMELVLIIAFISWIRDIDDRVYIVTAILQSTYPICIFGINPCRSFLIYLSIQAVEKNSTSLSRPLVQVYIHTSILLCMSSSRTFRPAAVRSANVK